MATDSTDSTKTVSVTADPATGRLLVSSSGGAAGTQYASGDARGTATGTLSMVDDGTLIRSQKGDTDGTAQSNTTKLAGTTIDTNSGSKSAGTQRVVLATDQPQLTNALKVDGSATTQPVSGTVSITSNSAINVAQINGVTPLMGNGVTGTGSQRVTIASDNTAFAVNATLSAETTKVIGVVRNADGSGNLLTSTSNALDINLKTSSITLTIAGAVTEATLDAALIAQEATTSGIKGLTAFGAVTTNAPTYTTAKSDALSLDTSGLLRVSLKDTPANTNKLLVTPDSVALPANQSINVSQINGITPLMGNGTTGTGSQRVTIASDNTAFSVNATLSAETTKVIGVVRNSDGAGNLWTSNSTTYTAKFAQDSNLLGTLGTAFSTAGKVDVKGADGDVFVRQATAGNLNATVVGTGTFSVQTTSDVPGTGATNLGKAEDAAAASGDTGVMTLGVRNDSLTAAQTNTNGDYGALSIDTSGILITAGAPRALKGRQATTITSSTSETTIVTAIASTFLDVYGLILTNTSATVTKVSIRDATAGGTITVLEVPATDTRGFMLPVDSAIPQATVNNNWTAQCGTSVASLEVSVLYVKRV